MPVVENNTLHASIQKNAEDEKDELVANQSSKNKGFPFGSSFEVDQKEQIKTNDSSEQEKVAPPIEQPTGHTEIFGGNNKEPIIDEESSSMFQKNQTEDMFCVNKSDAKTEKIDHDPISMKVEDTETIENNKDSQQFSASVSPDNSESQQSSVAIRRENNENQQPSINSEQPIPQEQNVLFEKILEGAGLDIELAKTELSNEGAVLIGKALRETLQGTMDLLRSRSETKNHMRLGGGDKTIISIAQNNPLKFLPNVEHIMIDFILSGDNENPAYMPLVEAIQESFDDLKAHQFALGMSIQEALSSTIHDYFSPENLQKKLEKSHPIGSKIPWQKNAKLWKLFEETYGDIEKEASETFQLVLEKKIADAYEANMMRLKQQRSMK
jgi:type VI secretion system FHA domain protein